MMLWILIDAVECNGTFVPVTIVSFNILPLAYQMHRYTIYDAVSFVHIKYLLYICSVYTVYIANICEATMSIIYLQLPIFKPYGSPWP